MLLSAGQFDDAARLSMTALSRLPNDTSIAECATRATTLAGALDDALAAAASWRRIGGADLADVETARATIEMVRRAPSRGYEVMRPLAQQVQLRASAAGALRMLVVTGVAAGREREVLGYIDGLSVDRRTAAVSAWLEAARTVEPRRRHELLSTLAGHRATENWFPAVAAPLLIAAWTEACRDGEPAACAEAESRLRAAEIPVELRALLASDLAAARDDVAAGEAYRAIYAPALSAIGLDVAGAASKFAGGGALDGMQVPALAVAAMNNHSELLQRTSGDAALALQLAQIARALAVGSAEAADGLARALAKSGRIPEALEVARGCDDPLLSAIAQGEILAASGDATAARSAARRAQTLQSLTMLPVWSVSQRLRALEQSLDAASAGKI
jgi:hypothetical protein